MGGSTSKTTKKKTSPAVVEAKPIQQTVRVQAPPFLTGPEWELSEWAIRLMVANPDSPYYKDHEQKIRNFIRYYRRHIARMFCTFCHQMTTDCSCSNGSKMRAPAPPWLMVHQIPDGYMVPMKIHDVQRGNSERHMKLSIGSAEWKIEFGKLGLCTGAFAEFPRGAVYPRDHPMACNFWTSLQSATHTLWTAQFSEPAFRRTMLDLLAPYFTEQGIGRLLLSYLEFPATELMLEFPSRKDLRFVRYYVND